MSIHKLTAGSGYDYLTRQVAALDATEKVGSDRTRQDSLLPLRPLSFPVYEFVRVRSRRALVTACPYPSLLK
jgi:hypothetical protein